jgi:hypothetical protein
MPTNPPAKRQALQTSGTFNARAAQVRHPLFQQSSFFDPEDLLQLKYETLRAVEIDHCPLAQAARDFGLSRPTIYEAQTQFAQQGLEGLLPRKRGPKAAHKLTEEILRYFQEQMAAQPELQARSWPGACVSAMACNCTRARSRKPCKPRQKGGARHEGTSSGFAGPLAATL